MSIAHKGAFSFILLAAFSPALAQTATPEDQPMTIGGIETVCTGTTTEARDNPLWQDYSLRLEFAGKDGQYLGDEQVTVTGNGHSVSVQCRGPWVLMKLPSGSYKVAVDVPEAGHRELTVRTPGRVVVRFPQAGGEISAEEKLTGG